MIAEPHDAPWAPAWLGAALATAVVAAVMATGLLPGDAPPVASVRWLDSKGKPVMVLRDDRKATIIWVLQKPKQTTGRGARCGGLARARRLSALAPLRLRGRARRRSRSSSPTPSRHLGKAREAAPRLRGDRAPRVARSRAASIPGAERFDRLLRDTLRYESLRVVKSKQRHVKLNEIERVRLRPARTSASGRSTPATAACWSPWTGGRPRAATSACRAASR